MNKTAMKLAGLLLFFFSSFSNLAHSMSIPAHINTLKEHGVSTAATLATQMYLNDKQSLQLSHHQKAQLDCMIMNTYMEARGESLRGKMMVANVVMNRVDHEAYPDTPCEVIFQPKQFSWTHNQKVVSRFYKISTVEKKKKEYTDSVYAAFYTVVFHGNRITPATYYYAPKAVKRKPEWVKEFKYVGRVGEHNFYFDATNATSS